MSQPPSPPPSDPPGDPRDKVFDTAHLGGNLGRRAGRGSIAVILFGIIKIVVQLGTTAILARLVPPADHGIIAMAMPAILIATGLSEFGLADAVIQRDHVTHRMASALFWTNTAIGVLLAAIIALLALPAITFYDEPRIGPVFLVLAPTVVFAAMGGQFIAILRRQMQVRQIETTLLFATVGALAVAVAMALAGMSYWAIAAQIVLQPVFSLVLLSWQTGWQPSAPTRAGFVEAKSFLTFGGTLAISRLIGQLTQNLGFIIVGRVFSPFEAGLYYRSWTLANLPQQRSVGPLASVFLPAFSRAKSNPEELIAVFKRASTRIALITMPVGVGICAGSDLIVAVVLGNQWTETAPLLAWLGILTLQANAMYTLNWALIALGQVRAVFNYRIFTALVTAAALIIGLRFGVVGMVAANMLAIVVILLPVLAVVVVRKSPIKLDVIAATFLPDAAIAAASIGGIFLIRSALPSMPAFAELVITAIIVAAIYAVRILMSPGLRSDVAKVAELVFRKRKA